MGFFKVLFLITAPLAGLTVAAFRLKRQLPIASRLFGNYIGLSYIYFKSIITFIKPVDHVPFEMISLARKTSQQSQALKRELKSTLVRVKEDLNKKKQETFRQFENESNLQHLREDLFDQPPKQTSQNSENTKENSTNGSLLMLSILKNRQILLQTKMSKKNSRKFSSQL